jgi:hypothetical protein
MPRWPRWFRRASAHSCWSAASKSFTSSSSSPRSEFLLCFCPSKGNSMFSPWAAHPAQPALHVSSSAPLFLRACASMRPAGHRGHAGRQRAGRGRAGPGRAGRGGVHAHVVELGATVGPRQARRAQRVAHRDARAPADPTPRAAGVCQLPPLCCCGCQLPLHGGARTTAAQQTGAREGPACHSRSRGEAGPGRTD